jgi:hypothetical protein
MSHKSTLMCAPSAVDRPLRTLCEMRTLVATTLAHGRLVPYAVYAVWKGAKPVKRQATKFLSTISLPFLLLRVENVQAGYGEGVGRPMLVEENGTRQNDHKPSIQSTNHPCHNDAIDVGITRVF